LITEKASFCEGKKRSKRRLTDLFFCYPEKGGAGGEAPADFERSEEILPSLENNAIIGGFPPELPFHRVIHAPGGAKSNP